MSTNIKAVRGAFKLGVFISGLTIASLGARLASATISPQAENDAHAYSIVTASGGSLSETALQGLAGEDGALIHRFDPAAPRAKLVDILAGYERAPDNLLKNLVLSGDTAAAINEATPFSGALNPPAKPFILHADAADRARAVTCLTQAVYYEAGFEPLDGEQAVAQVVLNRVRHPIFPHSVCGVVYQGSALKTGCQFSFTCDGSLGKTPAAGAWDRARKVAEQALNGYVSKGVGEATHYHTRYVSPWWAPTVTKVAEIGAHIFYRWPGDLGLPQAFNGRYSGVEKIGGGRIEEASTAPELIPGAAKAGQDGRVHATISVAAADPAPVATPQQRMQALAAKHALGDAFVPSATTTGAAAIKVVADTAPSTPAA